MYQQSYGLLDVLITAGVIAVAGYYLYRIIFKKKSACGSGCDSCGSSAKSSKK